MNRIPAASHQSRAFTLIEALATIVALSIIAATLAPIIYAASDAYANATSHRTSSESAAHAIDRMIRAIREIPSAPDSSHPDITAASSTSLLWSDSYAIDYDGNTQRILLTIPGQPPTTLADRVQTFGLRYLDAVAQPIDPAQPDSIAGIRRIEISLAIHGAEHRAAATIRQGLGAP